MKIKEHKNSNFLSDLVDLIEMISSTLKFDAVIVGFDESNGETILKEIYIQNMSGKYNNNPIEVNGSINLMERSFKLNMMQGNSQIGYVIIWQNPHLVCSLGNEKTDLSNEELDFSFNKGQLVQIIQLICQLSKELSKITGEKVLLQLEKHEEDCETIKEEILVAKRFIKSNFHKHLSLKEVANQVYFSQSHFSRLFKKEVGLNFTDYLNKERVRRAKELLIYSNRSINEISESVGFAQTSYFCKIFKENTTVSPAVFRREFGRMGSIKKEA